jgi:hypothetical protein
MKETELAAQIIEHLKSLKWCIYQEVQPQKYGRIIDIVALQGPLIRAIEVKTSFTSAVVEQAMHHVGQFHFVHVAIPHRRYTKGRIVLEQFLRYKGIGLIEKGFQLRETIPAQFFRKARTKRIREGLHEAQKYFAPAGTAKGGHWTPWKATCQLWTEYVKWHPGCTLKEIVTNEKHHYSSDSTARTSMVAWIRAGKVPGIEIRYEGNTIKLYPKAEK